MGEQSVSGPTSDRLLRACALALALASCSLSRSDVTACSSSSRCREVFGFGSVCNADGYCEAMRKNPRCNASFPKDLLSRPESYPSAILIGSLMDRSLATHVAREAAIILAATQADEAGGLGGRYFGVVLCDIAKNTNYDSLDHTEAAAEAARHLADAYGVSAIVGPSASTDAVAVYQALKERDVLLISPSATSPALSSLDDKNPTDAAPGRFWRTAPPDTLQGAAIALYLQAKAAGSVVVIHESGAYGEGLSSVFDGTFSGLGGQTTLSSFSTSAERDAAIATASKSAAPWVLFVSSQTADAVAFLNAAATLSGYAKKQLFLTDSAANADLFKGASGSSALFPRVRGSRFAVPAGEVYELFRASFKAAYKADANQYSYVAHAYDATWLTFYGAARSQGQEGFVHGVGIARGLRQLSKGPAADVQPSSWASVAQALAGGGSVDVQGASGALDYDPLTEETKGPVDIWKITGQSFEVEQTLAP